MLIAFGVATCALWLTHAVLPFPIPPLVAMPDLSGVLAGIAPWIREQAPELRRPDAEVIASLHRERLLILAWAWTLIGLGETAGILIIKRSRVGRWLAMGLAGLVMVSFARQQWTFVSETGTDAWRYWPMLFNRHPRFLVRVVLDVSFSVFTLVFLLRPSGRRRFASAPAEAPASPTA